jgi:hypothetical protein
MSQTASENRMWLRNLVEHGADVRPVERRVRMAVGNTCGSWLQHPAQVVQIDRIFEEQAV